MKKVIVSFLMMVVLGIPGMVSADSAVAQIGTTEYDSLTTAIQEAQAGDEVKLLDDVVVAGSTLKVDKDLVLNLNGKEITSSMNAHVITVEKGNFEVVGTGVIETTSELKSVIAVKGSNNVLDSDYTTVDIGRYVTLKGWCGLFVTPYKSGVDPVAYGVTINIDGKINQLNGPMYNGYAIYVNGQIQHLDNAPVINLSNTAVINSEGHGAYFAGYSIANIDGASITGVDGGIAAKAGVITVNDGSVIKAIGIDKTPTITYGDGINASGAAIQLESNTGYAGKIELNVNGGQIISEQGYAVYEYLDDVGGNTAVENISISGGMFSSGSEKEIFEVSDSFVSTHTEFITGGTFSSDPSQFVNQNYVSKGEDGSFVVGEVISTDEENKEEQNDTDVDTNDEKTEAIDESNDVTLGYGDEYDDVPKTGDTTFIGFIKSVLACIFS